MVVRHEWGVLSTASASAALSHSMGNMEHGVPRVAVQQEAPRLQMRSPSTATWVWVDVGTGY